MIASRATRGVAVGALWLGLAVTSAGAQEANLPYLDQLPSLLDRELFFDDPEITGAQLSPDGQFITFRKPYRGVMNIWIKEAREPFDAAQPINLVVTECAAGTFDTFVVDIQPLDDNEAGTATMYLMQDAPYLMVRSSAKLGAAMGGGTSSTELVEVSTAATSSR